MKALLFSCLFITLCVVTACRQYKRHAQIFKDDTPILVPPIPPAAQPPADATGLLASFAMNDQLLIDYHSTGCFHYIHEDICITRNQEGYCVQVSSYEPAHTIFKKKIYEKQYSAEWLPMLHDYLRRWKHLVSADTIPRSDDYFSTNSTQVTLTRNVYSKSLDNEDAGLLYRQLKGRLLAATLDPEKTVVRILPFMLQVTE